MAKDDDQPPTPPPPPPPPPSNDYHPANSISNIRNEVPEILDRDKGNYDNGEIRAIYLENQFNNLFVENFPDVSSYCQNLKELKDQLANVGQPVSERTLVLRLCAGLIDSDYDGVAQSITQTRPLPGFDEARSRILLEESRKSAKDNSGQAFVAQANNTTTTTAGAAQQQQQPSQQQGRGGGGGGRSNKGRGGKSKPKGRGRGQQQTQQQAQAQSATPHQSGPTQQQLWASFQQWAQQATWARPPAPFPVQQQQQSILGQPKSQQAYAAQFGQPMTPTDLAASFSTMTLPNPDNQWYVDSGATSHVTNNAGSSYGEHNNEM
ncbi:uncharacterized protein LOC110683317 [Chenopodium quinoa]|uniref:uncharacterized protein LOC110683317 n=1 Tax=Chenopodium quinoa TaxID=63459 RepID=UPI000B77CA48|nr:uncharacterized protein LOC110683317 [Chenopodium quinoa]